MTVIKLDVIRTDGGTQPREHMDENWVAEIADSIVNGDTMPPVIVFHDGTDYWLADGFHRVTAHRKLRRREIEADIRQGTNRDAILFSCGANSGQTALPRTNKDKRHAVLTLLRDAQSGCLPGHHTCTGKPPAEMCWSLLSDRDISRRCGVSHTMVARLRAEIEPADELSGNGCQMHQVRVTTREPIPERSRVVERKGTIYVQQTTNIGKSARRTIDRSTSQEEYPDDDFSSPLVSPPPTFAEPGRGAGGNVRNDAFDNEDISTNTFEFVEGLCAKLKANLAQLKPDLGYFITLARSFPAEMTFAEVLRLVEKRAAELSISLGD